MSQVKKQNFSHQQGEIIELKISPTINPIEEHKSFNFKNNEQNELSK